MQALRWRKAAVNGLVQYRQASGKTGVFSDLSKKLKQGLESNPELRKTLENLKEKTKTVAEGVQLAADEATQQVRKQAAQATSAFSSSTPGSAQPDSQSQSAEASTSGAASSAASASAGTAGPDSHFSEQRQQEQQASGSQQSTSGTRRPSVAQRLKGVGQVVWMEVVDVLKPSSTSASALRAPAREAVAPEGAPPGPSGLSVVKQQESAWQMQWDTMTDKLGLHPMFRRLRSLGDNRLFNKAGEVAGDMRERWETSDNRLVHKIQDLSDSLMTETEQARALREIRARNPAFDMVEFLQNVKTDVPTVVRAILKGDEESLAVLREYCSPEMMERSTGQIKAQQTLGHFPDTTILDHSDVELADMKFLENNPIVVVQFTCQQINCVRDQAGNVVDGAPDQVQRVFYYWALQQGESGWIGEDGKGYPPRWTLREMMTRGMHHLL